MFTSRRLIIFASALGLVAVVMVILGSLPRPKANAEANQASSSKSRMFSVYDATAARDAAIVLPNELTSARTSVYDATGVRDAAVVLPNEVVNPRPMVYDATGVMLGAITAPTASPTPQLFPVYDANGDIIFP